MVKGKSKESKGKESKVKGMEVASQHAGTWWAPSKGEAEGKNAMVNVGDEEENNNDVEQGTGHHDRVVVRLLNRGRSSIPIAGGANHFELRDVTKTKKKSDSRTSVAKDVVARSKGKNSLAKEEDYEDVTYPLENTQEKEGEGESQREKREKGEVLVEEKEKKLKAAAKGSKSKLKHLNFQVPERYNISVKGGPGQKTVEVRSTDTDKQILKVEIGSKGPLEGRNESSGSGKVGKQ